MNSFAIPAAAPTPTPAASGNPAAAASGASHFGDTLRTAQSSPETAPQGRAPADTHASNGANRKPDAGKQKGDREDAHDGKPAKNKPDDQPAEAVTTQPIAAPIAPPVAATPRQAPAADGKTLPAAAAATAPAATTGDAMAAAVATAAAATATAAGNHPVATPPLPLANVKATTPGAMASLAAPAEHADAADTPVDTTLARPVDTASTTDFANILKMPARNAAEPDAASRDHDAGPTQQGTSDIATQLTQLLAAHVAHPGNATPTPAPLQLAMQATPDQPQQFAQETAQHVAWLAGKGIDKAEIQLNPAKLGPISIEISNHHDRVDVSFAVAHPQTVHALQQTLPQLHDMLAQQGLNLGQASVGHQAPGQQHAAFAQHVGGHANGDTGNTEVEAPRDWRPLRLATPGRVDDFA